MTKHLKMNKEKEEKTSQNQEDTSKSKKTEAGENQEKSEGQDKDLKSALAQKEHFKEKFEKTTEEYKKLEEQVEKLKAKLPEKERDNAIKINSDDPIELVQTVAALKDFNSEELKEISAYARGKGINLTEAAQSEPMKAFVEARRKKVEAEQKIPGTTGRGSPSKKEDLSQKSEKELQENWEENKRKAIESGKNRSKLNI